MRYLDRGSAAVAGFLVLVLVAVTAASVFARYLLNTPIQWTEEFSGFLMIWIVFIGAISCEARNEHLTIDVVTLMLPDSVRRGLALIVGAASAILLAIMSWLGWELSVSALNKQTRLLGISWFWIDLAVVVGALGILTVLLFHLVRALRTGGELEGDTIEAADPQTKTMKGSER